MVYNILHVDDEKEIIKLLKMYLKSEDINHYEATNGREALAILAEKKIDLLIVDIMMPEIDGFELIRTVRKTSNLPILVISARVNALLRRYHALGASGEAPRARLLVGNLELDTKCLCSLFGW